AVLSYAVSGVLMILVIRAIGEMAVARPSSGSVANFSREGLGNWAGFSVGWLYWYFWVIVAAIEAVAGAGILVNYVPGVPAWLLCLGLVLVMTGINLLSVKAYGEAEFWFASIKVIAIIFFICVTGLYLLDQPVRPRRSLPVRHRGRTRGQCHGAVLDGWCRDRDHRRRRVQEARRVRGQS